MATQYSDIYIDGITTEELYSDGGQIVEAWLNGECIWKLIEGLEGYWKHIFCWTRYKNTNYGFGGYKPENIFTPKYTPVYFHGKNVENMLFSKHQTSGFSDGTIISAYDFGICTFSSSTVGVLSFDVNSTGTFNAKDFPERLEPVNNFLGDEFVNISTPLGSSCNVFNRRYHIFSADYGKKVGSVTYTIGAAVIKDVLNNTIETIVFDTPINGSYYALGPCTYFKEKVYFPGRKTSSSVTESNTYLPLFYINKYKELEHLETPVPFSTLKYANVAGVDANDSRIVWVCIIYSVSDSGTYLYEYDGSTIKYNLVYKENYASGVKIVGQYIVLYGFYKFSSNNHLAGYKMYAGKTIYDLILFNFSANDYGLDYGKLTSSGNSAMPRIFYEESGELFFDIVFTQEETGPTRYVGNSYVLKMKFNFDTGKIDEVSRTEINGTWEE